MCGISGIVNLDRAAPVPLRDLEVMNSWSQRRGPDDEGIWRVPGLGLAHRRLSIVDLSRQAAQPMTSSSGEAAIVFNGEIYDFGLLRARLEQEGVRFRSRSDTEVLLEGYVRWGLEPLLERIDGMFAFAIADRRKGELLLARDRFGQKPLYYSKDSDRFLFASDIRSIWAVRPGLTLDLGALNHFLVELAVPQPRSIWREVSQVEAAHSCTVRLSDLSLSHRRYWSPPRPSGAGMELEQMAARAEELLDASVRRMRVADVPIGCFLSGGVDSGLVVTTLARVHPKPVRTFTIGFPGTADDELAAARRVAAKFGTAHTELSSEAISPELILELADELGEPFADSSAIATYLVSRAMRSRCKVVLSGDGGDELFGGYWEYPLAARADDVRSRFSNGGILWLMRVADWAGRQVDRTVGARPPSIGSAVDFSARAGAAVLHRGMGFPYTDLPLLLAPGAMPSDGDAADVALQRLWDECRQATFADTLFEASVRGRLVNDYLVKVDRSAMASSLEVRVPFLDRELAEFAFSSPASAKLAGYRAKAVLKSIAEKRLGKDAVNAPKSGFGIPLGDLLRGPLRTFVTGMLGAGGVVRRGLFREGFVEGLLSEHLAGRRDHSDRLWVLVMFEAWGRSFLDRPGGPRPGVRISD